MDEFMLTTADNPYNPFTHFDEWFAWDTTAGYHTPAYLARVTFTADALSDTDQAIAIDTAMDEIVLYNAPGLYLKVKSDYVPQN